MANSIVRGKAGHVEPNKRPQCKESFGFPLPVGFPGLLMN